VSPSLRDLDGRDPYQVLGVARDASTRQIVEAHRRLVRQVHPDRPTGDAEATRLVNLARAVLTDPSTRAEYDRRTAAGPVTDEFTDPPAPSAWDADDVRDGAAASATSAWEQVAAEPPPGPFHDGSPFGPPYGGAPFGPPPPFGAPPAGPWTRAPRPSPGQHWRPPPVPRSTGWSLGVVALLCSLFCCTPVGLILGIVALSHRPAPGSTDRTCAIAAVVVSSLFMLCGGGYLLLTLIAGLGTAATG
jgi:hypothetical protein